MASTDDNEMNEGLFKKLGSSLKEQLAEAGETLKGVFTLNSGMELLISKTQEAITELIELDTTLTEIHQTSNLTKKELEDLGNTAFETASKYGKSASDYLSAVKEMYAEGYKNAKELAELSLLAQSAGDMDVSAVNAYLTATDEAYEYKGSVEALTKVLDGQNHITQNATVSLEDMAAATKESVSTASKCGVKMKELSALIGVVASETNESGEDVAKALNNIFTNLQNTTNEDIKEIFDSANISMTKMSNGSKVLKTPIELLEELSETYDRLSDKSAFKAKILSNIGGNEYSDALDSILSDWSAYENMLDAYSNGTGSAAKIAEKNANTIQGSLTRLSNTWTDTVQNVADSDAILAGVNSLNGLLTVLNKITDVLGSWGTIGLGVGLFAGIKNAGRVKC